MNIKKIIREELEGFKDSNEEDWEWTEGDVNLEGVLNAILSESPYTTKIEGGYRGTIDIVSRYDSSDLFFKLERDTEFHDLLSIVQNHHTICKERNPPTVTYRVAGFGDRYVCDYYKEILGLFTDYFEKAGW